MNSVARALLVLALAAAAAPGAAAQRLFKSDAPLEVTITTNLNALLKQRDSTELVKRGALASYADSSGATIAVPVSLRARGHFRRQARNCQFPPIYFEPKNAPSKGTLFANVGRLKLTTNCRPGNAEYEQYILQEFLLYRAYASLTDTSYRTRLVHVTYRDSANAVRPMTSWAFFIEDANLMAARLGGEIFKKTGAHFDDVDENILGLVGMFEYFAGNTDWSISGLHNITLVRDALMHLVPVPYDFDWSGAVNTRYATPDYRLKLRSVTQRLYRGDCRDEAALRPVVARLLAKRAAIDSLFTRLPQLPPGTVKEMRGYFADFWELVARPASLTHEVANGCQRYGN